MFEWRLQRAPNPGAHGRADAGWCNGNTADFGSVVLGSNPSPAASNPSAIDPNRYCALLRVATRVVLDLLVVSLCRSRLWTNAGYGKVYPVKALVTGAGLEVRRWSPEVRYRASFPHSVESVD